MLKRKGLKERTTQPHDEYRKKLARARQRRRRRLERQEKG